MCIVFGGVFCLSGFKYKSKGSEILIVTLFAFLLVALIGYSLTRLQGVSFSSLLSSEATMQAQHHAKAKMNYLIYRGYNNLVSQSKTDIAGSSFKDSVSLGVVTTDSEGISRRLVTVSVYKDDEVIPRASLEQVFYSNDANYYVKNDDSPNVGISLGYKDNKIVAKVNGVEKDLGGVPKGTVISWYGNLADLPSGWAICNGSNGTPDLRNRFIVGAGSTYALGNTGGADSVKLSGTQIGNHYHATGYHNNNNTGRWLSTGGTTKNYPLASGTLGAFWNGSGGGANSGQGTGSLNLITSLAVATAAQEAHENRPPYYALYYIMKIS